MEYDESIPVAQHPRSSVTIGLMCTGINGASNSINVEGLLMLQKSHSQPTTGWMVRKKTRRKEWDFNDQPVSTGKRRISEPSAGSQVSECFWEATSPPPNLHGWLHGECRFLFFFLCLAFQEITSLKQLDFEFTKSGSMIPPVLGNMVCFKIQICRPKNMSLKNQNKKKRQKKRLQMFHAI